MVRAVCCIAIAVLLLAGASRASDLKTFLYDAQGRLIATTRVVTTGPGSYVGYGLDDADNRTQRLTSAVPLPVTQNILSAGEALVPISSLRSLDGRSSLTLQADGNLVIFLGTTPLWTPVPNTATGRSMVLVMQGDGNLVLYDPTFTPIWFSGTGGNPGAQAVLQDDCNLVIYGTSGPLWSTGTSC